MIDDNGDEWLPVNDAAAAVNVRPNTIRVWISRGRVRSVREGRTRWVLLLDVQHAELEWRRRTPWRTRLDEHDDPP